MKNLLITFSIWLLPAYAFGNHADHPERPEHSDRAVACDRAAVAACRARERAASDQAGNEIRTLDAQIDAYWTDINPVKNALEGQKKKLAAIAEEMTALSTEIAFAATPDGAPVKEIFPDFPSVEELFQIHPVQRQWLDHYPLARAAALGERLTTAKAEEKTLAGEQGVISQKYDALYAQLTSCRARREQLVAEVYAHERAYQSGCAEQICQGRGL